MTGRGQALYLTLVDFLLQLIFLALLLGVLVTIMTQRDRDAAAQTKADADKENEENEGMRRAVEKIKKAAGISDLTVLTDLLTRLGPLSPATKHAAIGRELEKAVNEVGGVANAKRLLEEQIQRGQGKPSCLPDQRKLVAFHAFEDHIEVRGEASSDFVALLTRLQIPLERTRSMTFTEFAELFGPVLKLSPDCRYNVTVLEYSPYKKPRDVVRQAFIAFPVDVR